ncbi:MAG TPA: triose-phosphate isomerase [Candidatus Saccharimonadales bacterium]|nr:triose-phosphate isomerase [Candidatus Saccharimonadales bacterium]
MGKKLIVANWKMHFTVGEASLFLNKLQEKVPNQRSIEVVLCPNVLTLQSLSLQVDRRKFKLGAQNIYFHDEGAFTGEISASMLRGIASYVLVGHSERRHIFGETDKMVAHKMQAVLRSSIKPILCVGETKQERVDGETAHVLHAQVTAGLANITSQEIQDVAIAYEPVWAIGTGDFAKPDDAMQAVRLIRKHVEAMFGKKAAEETPILYGGSVDADNAGAYLAAQGIDGLLIGGTSLKANAFATIVAKANELQTV